MATFTEKKNHSLGVGDDVKHYDDGRDGHPIKWVEGKVTQVGEETFTVQWEDLPEDSEYYWSKVTIRGNEIIENH
jgi:hypothetical protein